MMMQKNMIIYIFGRIFSKESWINGIGRKIFIKLENVWYGMYSWVEIFRKINKHTPTFIR